MDDNWQEIAGYKHKNHQCMHSHPLHHNSWAPVATHIDLWKTRFVINLEEEE